MNRKQKNLLFRILAAAVFFIPLYLISEGWVPVRLPQPALLTLFLIPYLLAGHDILRKAFLGIRNRRVFDECFLMAAATLGAAVAGEYGEGVAVMLLYQAGELFQSCAVDRSRRSIAALMDIRPDYANLETEAGQTERTDPDEVEIGSTIVVNPGEKIPLDGVVLEGGSSLNTAALTGESTPRDVEAGEEVLSGCVNLTGVLRIRTTKAFDESTASKILDLVENAASRKSKSERFISKFARYYTPLVCGAALAVAVLPPLFCTLAGAARFGYATAGALWGDWLLRACTFLVISCPCAVVISVPLSFFAGLGGAGREGILIKGSNFLETLSNVRTVAFDKTGTITRGNFAVSGVHHSPLPSSELLEYAAHAELHSSHPISRSLREACGGTLDTARVSDVEERSGLGVTANVDGRAVAVGNARLMERTGAGFVPCRHPGTVVHVALDGVYSGHILISDELKENAREAVRALYQAGVSRVIMLTGDTEAAAAETAREIGVTEYRAGLLPGDKVACVEALLAEMESGGKAGNSERAGNRGKAGNGGRAGKRGSLAFVGDGINDAPVLSRADVGIAMGALGSDAAIEAADVVLMDDDPLKIARAVRISRKCMGIVRQNIAFALGVKGVCLLLAAIGIANMWVAVAADVGVMVLAVLNAVRCLSTRNL